MLENIMGQKPESINNLQKGTLYFFKYHDRDNNWIHFGNYDGAVLEFLEKRNNLLKFRVYSHYKTLFAFKGDMFWEEAHYFALYSLTKKDINFWMVDLL